MDTNKPALPKPVTDAAVTNPNPNNGTPATEQPETPQSWIARNGLSLALTVLAVAVVFYLFKRYSTDPFTDSISL
ncbi:MAG TPA: hypothetical protein VKS79_17340, partial [Gemmataceae bacterium]|nr:hypothetical protein [Gemmataceae bacterium]